MEEQAEYHTKSVTKPEKAWKCLNDGCDTILGVVDGGKLYPSEGTPLRLGDIPELFCPRCGKMRVWHPSTEGMIKILAVREKGVQRVERMVDEAREEIARAGSAD